MASRPLCEHKSQQHDQVVKFTCKSHPLCMAAITTPTRSTCHSKSYPKILHGFEIFSSNKVLLFSRHSNPPFDLYKDDSHTFLTGPLPPPPHECSKAYKPKV